MEKRFIKFLKEKNAYEKYITNAIEHHHATIDGIQERNPASVWVQCAFDWVGTPEGDKYWERLHNEWLQVLKGGAQ